MVDRLQKYTLINLNLILLIHLKTLRSDHYVNVKLLSNNFYMPQLNKNRRIWIYLPNDYETNTNKRYPVLYMHDGQNCFDKTTAFAGEWGIDETLNYKEKNGDKGCIVVAIDNGGASRLDEYSPYVNSQYGGGKGDDYLDFLALTLKPFIDSAYRTFPDKNNTAMAGSSMGGLITMYALFKYPNIYGKAGIFSPAFWFSNQLYTYVLNKKSKKLKKDLDMVSYRWNLVNFGGAFYSAYFLGNGYKTGVVF